jgi:AcrR family transcriptional regulator
MPAVSAFGRARITAGGVVPRTKTTRQKWVETTLALSLDQDRLPDEVSIEKVLAPALGVSKGSFYSHFREGRPELHAEVISQWLRDQVAALPEITVGAVKDPLDRIRMIRAALASTAVRDGAMRRWAASDRSAAEAVAEADRTVTSRLERALTNLGFAAAEAAAVARWLAASLRSRAIADDQAAFDAILQVLGRAAEVNAIETVSDGETVVLYPSGGQLTGEEQQALEHMAHLLTRRRDPSDLPRVQREAHAGEA